MLSDSAIPERQKPCGNSEIHPQTVSVCIPPGNLHEYLLQIEMRIDKIGYVPPPSLMTGLLATLTVRALWV